VAQRRGHAADTVQEQDSGRVCRGWAVRRKGEHFDSDRRAARVGVDFDTEPGRLVQCDVEPITLIVGQFHKASLLILGRSLSRCLEVTLPSETRPAMPST
jgi:hypothetical protein